MWSLSIHIPNMTNNRINEWGRQYSTNYLGLQYIILVELRNLFQAQNKHAWLKRCVDSRGWLSYGTLTCLKWVWKKRCRSVSYILWTQPAVRVETPLHAFGGHLLSTFSGRLRWIESALRFAPCSTECFALRFWNGNVCVLYAGISLKAEARLNGQSEACRVSRLTRQPVKNSVHPTPLSRCVE